MGPRVGTLTAHLKGLVFNQMVAFIQRLWPYNKWSSSRPRRDWGELCMRLLVVDDSPIDRLLLTRALTNAFPEANLCVIGSDIKEFEAAVEEAPCDLLVADYSLGWADGFEVMRGVRR